MKPGQGATVVGGAGAPCTVRMVGPALLVLLLVLGCGPQAPAEGSDDRTVELGVPLEKSIALYVGSALTEDGSVLLAGFGHEPSSHWLEVTESAHFPAGTTLEVGITEEARLPGRRIRVAQEGGTARFVSSNYSEFAGFPSPLTNGGLNEHGVAARTVWSPSRPELVERTPSPQTGMSYSDLARSVMERATTAREAAELVGELVEAHGYATYGGNSFLFADSEEGWMVITYAGGERLWAAERLGEEDVRVLYPGYIREFPVDFQDDLGYLASEHLVDFATGEGWFDPSEGRTLDLPRVFGRPFPSEPSVDDAVFRYPPEREEEVRDLAPVSLEDAFAWVRDPRWSDDRAGYGQVAHLRPDVPGELETLWVSVAPAVSAPLVPFHVGARDVPLEFKQHRYMTAGASSTFLDPRVALLEGTRSAFRAFKRLFYLTCSDPEAFYGPVTAELEELERGLLDEVVRTEEVASELLATDRLDQARDLLTVHLHERLLEGMELAIRLAEAVEGQVRSNGPATVPEVEPPEGATWRPESEPMALPEDAVDSVERLHCYVPGLVELPRGHDSFADLTGELVPLR